MELRPVECNNDVLAHVTGRQRDCIKRDGSISGCHESHNFFFKYGAYIHVRNVGGSHPHRALQPPVTIKRGHRYWRVEGNVDFQGNWVVTSRTLLETKWTVFTITYFGGKKKSLYKPGWSDDSLVKMATEAFRDFRNTDPFYGVVGAGESGSWSGTFRETQDVHYVLTGKWKKMVDKDCIKTFWIDWIEQFTYINN